VTVTLVVVELLLPLASVTVSVSGQLTLLPLATPVVLMLPPGPAMREGASPVKFCTGWPTQDSVQAYVQFCTPQVEGTPLTATVWLTPLVTVAV
jgi:hypothetical protein